MSEASEDRKAVVNGTLAVNGTPSELPASSRLTLADYLRDELHLTGTHVGCEQGICGSCTVLVNGSSVRACLTLAAQVDGTEVTTVEGLADDELNVLQQAFADNDALQCGFCTPGMLMTCTEIMSIDGLTHDDFPALLSGNLCRCTGYEGILAACRKVYASLHGGLGRGRQSTL